MPPTAVSTIAARRQVRVTQRTASGPGPRPEQWDLIRPRLEAWYIEQTLPQIRAQLAKEGFHATEKQFKARFKKWGLAVKNIKSSEINKVLDEIRASGRLPPQGGVYVWNGKEYPAHKLLRQYKKRLSDSTVHLRVPSLDRGDVLNLSHRFRAIPQSSCHTSFVQSSVACLRASVSKDGISSGDNEMSDDTLGGETLVTSSLTCSPTGTSETVNEADMDTSLSKPYGPQNEVEQIFDWVWKVRVHAGILLWMFDFLQFCVDPEYSPLVQSDQQLLSLAEINDDPYMCAHERDISTAMRRRYQIKISDELEGYKYFINSPSQDVKQAHSGLCRVIRELKSGVILGNERQCRQGMEVELQMLHLMSRRKHIKFISFNRESLELEVQNFLTIQKEAHARMGAFVNYIGTELRAPFQRSIRPIDSPAAFFSQLRDILLFTRLWTPNDPEIDYGKIKALFPGPFPGLTMGNVHYSNDAYRFCSIETGDPLDIPLYEIEDEDTDMKTGWTD